MRRTLILFSVVALGALGGVSVAATGSDDGGNTYTGCLNKGGVITNVAIGDQPLKSCAANQVRISWSEGVSPEDVTALAERVEDLEARTYPLELSVDCTAGETVGDALAEAQAGEWIGPVRIGISGVCVESVGIFRDDVTLFGIGDAEIRAPMPDEPFTIGVFDAKRVHVEDLIITGGRFGVQASQADITAFGVTAEQATETAIYIAEGSSAQVFDTVVTDNDRFGVAASSGGIVTMGSSTVQRNGETGVFAGGAGGPGSITVGDSAILDNHSGAGANVGGFLSLSNTLVAGNEFFGVFGIAGQLSLDGTTRIVGNGVGGLSLDGGADVYIGTGPVTVEGNQGDGISVGIGSSIRADELVVTGNDGSGISVQDLSVVGLGHATITDNGGWGITCDGPPSVATIGGQLNTTQPSSPSPATASVRPPVWPRTRSARPT